jgi:splicing factor 3B subunit 3
MSLIGRDHLTWQGYFVPVKSTIDGDLREVFTRLLPGKQSLIAGELDSQLGKL